MAAALGPYWVQESSACLSIISATNENLATMNALGPTTRNLKRERETAQLLAAAPVLRDACLKANELFALLAVSGRAPTMEEWSAVQSKLAEAIREAGVKVLNYPSVTQAIAESMERVSQ